MRSLAATTIVLMTFFSCTDGKDCQTCTKTIGGVAGNTTVEVREVCSDKEAESLKSSSSGTTTWNCE